MCRVYQTASRRNRSATVDDGDQVPSQPIGHDLVVGALSDVVADDDRKPDVVCIGADCPQPLQANLVGPGIVVSRGIDRIGEEPSRVTGVTFAIVAWHVLPSGPVAYC